LFRPFFERIDPLYELHFSRGAFWQGVATVFSEEISSISSSNCVVVRMRYLSFRFPPDFLPLPEQNNGQLLDESSSPKFFLSSPSYTPKTYPPLRFFAKVAFYFHLNGPTHKLLRPTRPRFLRTWGSSCCCPPSLPRGGSILFLFRLRPFLSWSSCLLPDVAFRPPWKSHVFLFPIFSCLLCTPFFSLKGSQDRFSPGHKKFSLQYPLRSDPPAPPPTVRSDIRLRYTPVAFPSRPIVILNPSYPLFPPSCTSPPSLV